MPEARVWPDDAIILYDGVCILCSGWVKFVMQRDVARRFRFTPIQSPYGSRFAAACGIDPANPDTNALVIGGRVYRRSDAALAVLSRLPGWGWITVLHIVPHRARDFVYDLIAQNRYRLFGRRESCDVDALRYADRVVVDLPPAFGEQSV
jgi:predicted DCC family thiol-disulfide oxidoreductase YuxK